MADIEANEHPLLRWRREHRMSLAAMAERSGVTTASLSRIENGKQTPSYRLARRLGALTGLAPEIFLDRPPAAPGAARAAGGQRRVDSAVPDFSER